MARRSSRFSTPPAGIDPGWHRWAKVGLIRAVAEVMLHSQGDESLEAACSWLSDHRYLNTAVVLDALLERVAPLIGIEKSPGTTLNDESLRRVARLYPRARFLHLVRHPTTTQLSMQRHWSGRPWTPSDLPDVCARVWYLTHLRILAVSQELARDAYLRVRAEDILNEPADTLRRVTEWLGLCGDDNAVEAMLHPERSPYAHAVAIGPANDPGFVRDPVLRRVDAPNTIEVPASWRLDAGTKKGVLKVAEFHGYSS